MNVKTTGGEIVNRNWGAVDEIGQGEYTAYICMSADNILRTMDRIRLLYAWYHLL